MTLIPSNPIILEQLAKSREAGQLLPDLAETLKAIAERTLNRLHQKAMTYDGDVQAAVIEKLFKMWTVFKPEKSDDPFAFFATVAHCSYTGYMARLAKQRIKDEVRN